MAACIGTKKDGTQCFAKAQENGYCATHTDQTEAFVAAEPAVKAAKAKPAFLKGMRRARAPRFGQRRVKMLRPICRDGCQEGPNPAHDWYLSCPHDPYVGKREKRTQVPIYSEPLEDGSVVLERMEERISWEAWPNFVQVTLTMMVNSGQGVEMGRAKGFILPSELRSPVYPAGLAPFCQFRNCFWQHGLTEYKVGVFCQELEARRVAQSETLNDKNGSQRYGAIEVLHSARMAEQLEKVAI